MTGHKLIAALQTLSSEDLDLEVLTEGCDCYGTVGSIDVERYPNDQDLDRVVIYREDHERPGAAGRG